MRKQRTSPHTLAHPQSKTHLKNLIPDHNCGSWANPPHNPNTEFALVITFTPEAVIECMIMARTPSDMAALAATHLKFDDGTETELVPASAFASK
jgi:hypothetical protein